MTGKGKVIYALILGTVILATGYNFVKADSSNPTEGTVNDPLVTKSYVDGLFKGGVTGKPAETAVTEDKLKQMIADQLKTAAPGAGNNGTSTITIVQLVNGQTLYAGTGTEVIVRTGKIIAVSIDGNGIPDTTAGKDIAAGAAIEANHLLIFPREGRGIKSAPKNTQDIYVMVRGAYTVMNEDGTKAAQQ